MKCPRCGETAHEIGGYEKELIGLHGIETRWIKSYACNSCKHIFVSDIYKIKKYTENVYRSIRMRIGGAKDIKEQMMQVYGLNIAISVILSVKKH